MKLEFDVKVTEKDLYSFNIEQAYKGSQGVISLLFAVLLAAAAVLSAQKGNTEYVVLYIIVGILDVFYTHPRAHETGRYLVLCLVLDKKQILIPNSEPKIQEDISYSVF